MTDATPEVSGEVVSPATATDLAYPFLSQVFVEGDRVPNPVVADRRGMWGSGTGSSDTSGFNNMTRQERLGGDTGIPFGGWFDAVANRMAELVPHFAQRVSVWRDKITFHVVPDKLLELCRALRDDDQLRFEVCVGMNGVHYPDDAGAELHAVYMLLSYTHNRRICLEVTCSEENPHIPSITPVYPMANYHERETYDMFGIVFDGHPGLTRILMPDDWAGHPQRKDYPLGGVPIEYHGAVVPPVNERRSYQQ